MESAWDVTILTLFPDMFPGPLGFSILGRSLEEKRWHLNIVDIRDYAHDKHRTVDDMTFGGGPGMVMRPEILNAALEDVTQNDRKSRHLIYLSPRGKPVTQERVKELAQTPKVAMVCGRFEGIDQRILDAWNLEELSLGDFILAGGEVAAMALTEACVRLLPGVVGASESLEEESFSKGLLEYPHYTRPRQWQGREVPDVLMSGNHEVIRSWRLAQAEKITQERRPDMWQKYVQYDSVNERKP
jgi:tRNA (guanine37-N1)-methyltransferase